MTFVSFFDRQTANTANRGSNNAAAVGVAHTHAHALIFYASVRKKDQKLSVSHGQARRWGLGGAAVTQLAGLTKKISTPFVFGFCYIGGSWQLLFAVAPECMQQFKFIAMS